MITHPTHTHERAHTKRLLTNNLQIDKLLKTDEFITISPQNYICTLTHTHTQPKAIYAFISR